MAWALFLLVAGIWAVVLLPPLWAERFRFSPNPTRRHSDVAGEPAQVSSRPSGDASSGSGDSGDTNEGWEHHLQILSRRRRAIAILVMAIVVSLVAAVVIGGR